MTFPIDPGLLAFQAKNDEHVLRPDPSAQPVPAECVQAEDAEHSGVMAGDPDAGALQSS